MHSPNEGDVVEQGGPSLELPGWLRRPRWLTSPGPALDPGLRLGLGRRRSRRAALFGLATLLVGLAAGYALGHRQAGQPTRPAPSAPAAAASLSSSAPSGTLSLFGLAQTGERPNRDHAAGRAR